MTAQRLTHAEAEALWRAWYERRDASARDHLVLSYAPMVRYLASRKVRELPSHCELDDLVSCGLIALVEAVERFRPEKGATFEQHAWTRVAGSIVDELRRQDFASRSTRRLGRKAERVVEAWYAKHGVEPTEQELAKALDVSVAELRERSAELDRSDVLSLNAPTRTGGEDGLMVEIGDTVESVRGNDTERTFFAGERSSIVRKAIESLSERERRVLTMAHVEELPGAQIGRILGVSESRVSQILGEVRAKLRAAVEGYDTGEVVAA